VKLDIDDAVANLPHPYLRDIVAKLAAVPRDLRSFFTHCEIQGF
jgi:hypothetical protein